MKIIPSLFLTLMAGGALFVAGCSKSEAGATDATAAAPAANGVREIEITADAPMTFSVAEIRAQAGEKLRVAFTNLGRMPKQAMAHNLVVLVPMDDAAVNALAQSAAANTPEYLPADAAKIVVHTRLLGPKETDTIEFAAPATAGMYPFVCTFPGHAALMRGKLIVTAKP
jgi:azurin